MISQFFDVQDLTFDLSLRVLRAQEGWREFQASTDPL